MFFCTCISTQSRFVPKRCAHFCSYIASLSLSLSLSLSPLSADPTKFREDLLNIARTTLSSKILVHHRDHFSNLAVNAVLRLKVTLIHNTSVSPKG